MTPLRPTAYRIETMKPIDYGGPAFPCALMDFQPETGTQVVREQYFGLTVRAYLAGRALPELIRAANDFNDDCRERGSATRITRQDVASGCVEYADALISELNKNA